MDRSDAIALAVSFLLFSAAVVAIVLPGGLLWATIFFVASMLFLVGGYPRGVQWPR